MHRSLSLLAGAVALFLVPACAQVDEPARPTSRSSERIWDLLPDRDAATRAAAFAAVQALGDPRDLAPLGDLLRLCEDPTEWFALLDALQPFFEQDLREQHGVWSLVTRETARRIADLARPLPQHSDYAQWKGELLALSIDPEYRRFFPAGVAARIRLEEAVWGGVEVDGIPSLDDADRIAAADASFLHDDEAVLGLAWNGEAHAFPLRILDWHEMANDELGGVPFSLAYCTLCGAAVAYRTAVGEGDERRVHRFGSSGLLMRSNKLMFDRATDSLWNQLTGEPVTGTLADSGLRLPLLPVVLTTWGDWRIRHPHTTTVRLETGFDRRYEPGAAYGSYFASRGLMFPALSPVDGGFGPVLGEARPGDKEQLFVVRDGEERAVFRRSAVEAEGILHGRLGDERIVLLGPKRRDRRLPDAWRLALAATRGVHAEGFAEVEPRAFVEMLRVPARFAELRADHLLAMPAATRAAVLEAFAPERAGGGPRVAASMRDAVAVQALIAPIRAYSVGSKRFRRDADDSGWLVDEAGARWRVLEEALRAEESEDSLRRLPGHLVFGLGWRAFLSDR